MTTATENFVAPSMTASLKRSRRRLGWIVLTPFVVSFIYSALLTYKPTRMFALQMADENYPVELLTFALLMAGGIYGVRLAMRARRQADQRGDQAGRTWVYAFYLIFAVMLLLIGMEEISWGQWFFHFETPESIARINTQHEFTLHNLKGLGGNTVWLRLAFGVGGFAGIALGLLPRLRRTFHPVAVPPILWAWFLLITLFAAGDLATDYIAVGSPVAALFEVMSEVVELLIAAVACLYLWLKSKELLG